MKFKLMGLLLGFLLTMSQNSFGTPVFFSISFNDALKKAAAEQKIVFIDFYADWCRPCKMLDDTTWKNPSVVSFLKKNTIPLKIDAEKHVELAKKYSIKAYPSMVFINADGLLMDKIVGFRNESQFIKEATSILSGKNPLLAAKERFDKEGHNSPMARFDYAQKLVELGKYKDALEHYKWCYEKGVEADPSFIGVRNTFLLMYIGQLAEDYSPAKDMLVEIRDIALNTLYKEGLNEKHLKQLIMLNRTLRDEKSDSDYLNSMLLNTKDEIKLQLLVDNYLDLMIKEKKFTLIYNTIDLNEQIKNTEEQFRNQEQEMTLKLPENQQKEIRKQIKKLLVINLSKFYSVYIGMKKYNEAAILADKIFGLDNSSTTYNSLAWAGYQTGSPSEDNLKQAVKAFEMTKGQDTNIVDTVARLYNYFNQRDKAQEIVNTALKHTSKQKEADKLKKCLEYIKSQKH